MVEELILYRCQEGMRKHHGPLVGLHLGRVRVLTLICNVRYTLGEIVQFEDCWLLLVIL